MTLSVKIKYLLGVLLLSFALVFLWLKNQVVPPERIPFDIGIIKNGDLVFRQGRGIFSDIFKNIGETDSPFSHVGIVYKDGNDIFVIHTEANELTGVGFAKKEKLSDFISNSNSVTYDFYRIDDFRSARIQSVLKAALKYVNDKIPFDTDFNLRDNDRLYCTELVYKAFKSAGINLVGKPSMIQVPSLSGLHKLEAIPIGQLLNSESIKLIPTHKRRSE